MLDFNLRIGGILAFFATTEVKRAAFCFLSSFEKRKREAILQTQHKIDANFYHFAQNQAFCNSIRFSFGFELRELALFWKRQTRQVRVAISIEKRELRKAENNYTKSALKRRF